MGVAGLGEPWASFNTSHGMRGAPSGNTLGSVCGQVLHGEEEGSSDNGLRAMSSSLLGCPKSQVLLCSRHSLPKASVKITMCSSSHLYMGGA